MTSHRLHQVHPPAEVVRIARRLEEAGYATWAVGGAVRDALIGREPGDWDLTTAARPGDVRRLFRRTVPIGVEHGTVGVVGKDGVMYEVTTFRRDVETFGRRARVSFADSLEEDLERRDFTINAVAWHPTTGELRDPHHGADDLRNGVLRTVGDPAARFAEDRLRVLRALRFAGRFDLRIDPATWSALRASAGELGALSAERVREELYKVLAGQPRASMSLELYRESGVLAALFPELQACVGVEDGQGEEVWTHLLRTVDAVSRSGTTLRVAALLHDVGKPRTLRRVDGRVEFPEHAAAGAAIARGLLRRLRASNAETDRVSHLVAQHADVPGEAAPAPELRRWVRRVGPDYLGDLLRLRFADCRARGAGCDPAPLKALRRRLRRLLAERPPLGVSDLAIGGAELRELGIPAGPLYGEILKDLLERVTDDPTLNRADRLRSLVEERLG
jgi:putative nucleotidyltransferase with HDIG domain